MERETILAQVKTALQVRGWTLHLQQRRNRPYAYAARRTGTRTEDVYLGPLDDLTAMLARIEALPNRKPVPIGQRSEKHDQTNASERDPERLRLQSDLLELGRRMGYRRFIVVPFFIDPGLDAWTRYSMTTDTPTLGRVIQAARVYSGHLKEVGLMQEPNTESSPPCSTLYDGAIMDRHVPNTNAPGSYDPLGNYWCADCAEHCEVMYHGAQLGWPQVSYFPRNPPGMQALMVKAGADAWREYLRIRGKQAARVVREKTQDLLKAQGLEALIGREESRS
ncbi:MAG TPA: hypothetical protein VGT44_02045 [Ktedonobacteraceae bacterium]|nr:hypothetical protein [Ktedonobacteraceae bacterium]